jgi:ABC-type bacteriocin/lantibiotic exporter with double-glycine peptidase domain
MGHPRRASLATLAQLAFLLCAGCHPGIIPDAAVDDLAREPGWRLARGARGVRQEGDADCGAAALSMVLTFWGRAVEAGRIRSDLLAPRERGIRARVLRDYARREGMNAFIIQGRHDDLVKELGSNRPVIVGLGKAGLLSVFPHYEVVVGINPAARWVLSFDPAKGFRTVAWEMFRREWEASGFVGLVMFPDEKLLGDDVANAEKRAADQRQGEGWRRDSIRLMD